MRGSIGRTLYNPNSPYLTSITKGTSYLLQSSFSTSSSSGSGRGRGRGGASPSGSFIDFTPAPEKSDSEDSKRGPPEPPPVGLGHGHGRGRPLSSDPIPHSLSSFVSQTGSGRGGVKPESVPPRSSPPGQPKQPMFINKNDESETDSPAKLAAESIQSSDSILPSNIFSGSEDSKRGPPEPPHVGLGHGHGRGRPLSSDPIPQSFSSFVSQTGSGRGGVKPESVPPRSSPPGQPKQPMFINKNDGSETDSPAKSAAESIQSSDSILPSNIFSGSVLSGAGRGKPVKQPEPASEIKEENRHIRVSQQQVKQEEQQQQQAPFTQLSKDEAAKKAMSILSRRSESEDSRMAGRGGTAGMGRGRGGGRGMGRGRGRRQREDTRMVTESEGYADALYLGDDRDGEKLATTIGTQNMNKLVEGFEEMSSRVLPSPTEDAYLDALHTNCLVSGSALFVFAQHD